MKLHSNVAKGIGAYLYKKKGPVSVASGLEHLTLSSLDNLLEVVVKICLYVFFNGFAEFDFFCAASIMMKQSNIDA